MGIKEFHAFIEENCKEACKAVDLIKIARGLALSHAGKKRGPNRLCLIVDAESCLDRLYGGYYSDWACGGQWNRMNQFLHTLVQACGSAHMELVIFFNGGLENQRLSEWFIEQQNVKKNANNVLKHINNKATPPPKVWWIPPVSLHSSIRMALRQYGVPVALSLEDHHQELVQYMRENNFHGVIADESDYAIFGLPRYFSAQHLKLTYKGALETIEYVMDEVAKSLDLHPKRFCIAAALLGNHIFPEDDLEDFHIRTCNVKDANELKKKFKSYDVIQKVIQFVRQLPSTENLDVVAKEAFSGDQNKISKFKLSVHYYMNGTTEYFGKYRKEIRAQIRQSNNNFGTTKEATVQKKKEISVKKVEDWDGTKSQSQTAAEEIGSDVFSGHESGYANEKGKKESLDNACRQEDDLAERVTKESIERKESFERKGEKKAKQNAADKLYKLSQDAIKIARDRHQKGLMHPWVYQILAHTEIKIDYSLEDENNRELPMTVDLYRPIRQLVYSILFDYNKRMLIYRNYIKDGKNIVPEKPKVVVKEWFVSRGNQNKPKCEEVTAEELDWLVPGLHRLWLGQETVDKNRRLRAFLSCLNSDVPLMLNTTYIPQHLIVLCAVLRYMVLFKDQRVLRKHELDAFLATAVSPLLADVDTMQEMKLPLLTSRGVQLGTLFMRGVEHAIFVNDSCGAPVPWGMCCPWLFFDGKLFHFKLLKANNNTPLIDICDGQVDQVMRVERMRQAILQGVPLDLVFAKQPLPAMQNQFGLQQYGINMHSNMARNAVGSSRLSNRGRGILCGTGQVDQRGGQLQIAGVVVGNWGPNVNSNNIRPGSRGANNAPPPQVTSVGPRRGIQRGIVSSAAARGRGFSRFGHIPRGSGRGQIPRLHFYHGHPNVRNNSMRGGTPGRHYKDDRYGSNAGTKNANVTEENTYGHNSVVNQVNSGHGNYSRNNQTNDINRVTLAERTKTSGGGRGRGCTVESQDGGKIVSVSQLMKSEVPFSNQNIPHATHNQMSQTTVSSHIAPGTAVSVNQHILAPQGHIQQQPSHTHQIQSQISSTGPPIPAQVTIGHAGHLPTVSMHSGGPPQLTQLSLNQGHMNLSNIATMSQVGQMAGINLNGQGQLSQVSLGAPAILNGGSGDFGGTFQNIHHNDIGGIGQNELNMNLTGQVPEFPVMDSHIGVFHDAD